MLSKMYDDLPEYNDLMYQKGYSPEQISMALKKKMLRTYLEDQETDPVEEFVQKVYKELKKK